MGLTWLRIERTKGLLMMLSINTVPLETVLRVFTTIISNNAGTCVIK